MTDRNRMRVIFEEGHEILIRDIEGDDWVVRPSWTGGLEILAYDPSESSNYYHTKSVIIYPEDASTVHLVHASSRRTYD